MATALITGGGGAKGSFSIGALLAMRARGISNFDIISGSSTGSFIATLVAANELEALQRQYLNVEPNDILTRQNIINNLVSGRPFIFDTNPLLDLVRQHISEHVYDKVMSPEAPTLCIAAVSLQTGRATVFSNRDLRMPSDDAYDVRKFFNRDEMMKALLASGSQAGFTPPVLIGDEQFVDGGHRDIIPTRVVVDQNVDRVFVLSNNPETQSTKHIVYTDLLPVVLRAIAIFLQDVQENDMRILTEHLASRGKAPILISPEQDLDEENPTGLRFNPIAMMAWMNEGFRRANEVLDLHGLNGSVGPIV